MLELITILLIAIAPPAGQAGSGTGSASRTPVVVELFTSEGCSSCPPADALLAQVSASQPFDAVEIIGLEMHVDYWDRLGWKDPFSSAAFTRRQQDYATALKVADIYTPQIVVDGAAQVLGSDGAALRRAVQDASGKAHLPVRVATTGVGNAVRVSIEIPPAPAGGEPIDVVVALAESGLVSQVARGENGGRTLTHGAVVRRLERVGKLETDGAVTEGEWKLNPRWDRGHLRAVAWLQGRASHRIYGAATSPIR